MIKSLSILVFLAQGLVAYPYLKDVSSQVRQDTLTLYALDAQIHQNYFKAAEFYQELYKSTDQIQYQYESLKMLEQSGEIETFVIRVNGLLKQFPNDLLLKRFEIIGLMKEAKFLIASQKAFSLCAITKQIPDFLLYGEANLKLRNYVIARDALKQAYEISHDPTTCERIALIEYRELNEQKQAIELINHHIGTYGKSLQLLKRLGLFYSEQRDYDAATKAFEDAYATYDDVSCAEEALQIYLYQKQFDKVQVLLEKSHVNDKMLLDLYAKNRAFLKASDLAYKLYERENDVTYLAQSAMFLYESTSNERSQELIEVVVERLGKAIDEVKDPTYLNYLGYLMIENNMDLNDGIHYIKMALEKEPESPYYLDSLAWGLYKQGKCTEAMIWMKKAKSFDKMDEEEMKQHYDAIDKCVSISKN